MQCRSSAHGSDGLELQVAPTPPRAPQVPLLQVFGAAHSVADAQVAPPALRAVQTLPVLQ